MTAIAMPTRRRTSSIPATPRYVAGRIGQAVLALFGVTTIVFFALRLSGDPARLLVPEGATAEDIERVRDQLGLNASLWQQYLSFLGNAVRGDLGYSFVQNRPATTLIAERLPYTANLAVAALLLSLLFGVSIGVITALNRGRWQERVLMPIVLIGQAMPAFWTGLLLVLVFSVGLRWLPSTGYDGPLSLLLPSVTLASLSAAAIARVTRGAVLEQLSQDYVRTARAKGAGTTRLVVRHLARNSAIPVLTVAALELANLLGGAVVTEVIFAWPGIGQLTIQSVAARDFPVVQAIVLFASAVYIVINLLTDLLYCVIDRRVASGLTGGAA
ncbi:ABC transporter permease [Saccharopolyspora sp. K220]|uniref:ABC transporter permease n=1 Tax=Saccharopolyspora soli TaxID=2926618 RepID=UPI001F5A0AC5|nr:ABC transporter permease [Saccharopolyspora soli]MCI2416942.1 ABC transporter permease [Saccharopolyspora soli]